MPVGTVKLLTNAQRAEDPRNLSIFGMEPGGIVSAGWVPIGRNSTRLIRPVSFERTAAVGGRRPWLSGRLGRDHVRASAYLQAAAVMSACRRLDQQVKHVTTLQSVQYAMART
jgi:hypothetical protein